MTAIFFIVPEHHPHGPTQGNCWINPSAPPVPSDSSKYAKGTCNVCVSQTLSDIMTFLTAGTTHSFDVRIRDGDNRDMGAANKTLAAFGGETGGKDTVLSMPVGGRTFHLWAMRDPDYPNWAAVYMDWDGPGPSDPFRQPQVLFSAVGYGLRDLLGDDVGVGHFGCGLNNFSPNQDRVYFQCGFEC